jgi:hypothetical protein
MKTHSPSQGISSLLFPLGRYGACCSAPVFLSAVLPKELLKDHGSHLVVLRPIRHIDLHNALAKFLGALLEAVRPALAKDLSPVSRSLGFQLTRFGFSSLLDLLRRRARSEQQHYPKIFHGSSHWEGYSYVC